MAQCTLEIIILTMDSPIELKQCVESLIKHTTVLSKVYIVNNGAIGKVVEFLSVYNGKTFGNVEFEVVNLTRNIGAVLGRNIILSRTHAPYVCFLDNDVIVTSKWAERAIAVLNSNKQLGFLGTCDLKQKMKDIDLSEENIRIFSEKLFNTEGMAYKICSEVISFCCFIKREVIDKLGCLDEEIYLVDFEDIDYSLRANLLGYHCGLTSGVGVYHHKNVTQNKIGSIKKSRNSCLYVNERWYKKKWPRHNYLFYMANSDYSLLDAAAKLNLLHEFVTMYTDQYVALKKVQFDECKDRLDLFYIVGIKYLYYSKRWQNDFRFICKVLFKMKKRFTHVISDNESFLNFFRWFGMQTIYYKKGNLLQETGFRSLLCQYSYILVDVFPDNIMAELQQKFANRIITINDFWRLKLHDFDSNMSEFSKTLLRLSQFKPRETKIRGEQ